MALAASTTRARKLARSGNVGGLMRALLISVAVIAVVLILLGLFIEAIKWLLIVGLVALAGAIVMGVIQARRAARQR